MIRNSIIFAVAGAGLAFPGAVMAQDVAYPNAEAEALAECVVLSTSGRDRLDLMRWLATSIGMAKSIQDAVKVDPDAKLVADQRFGALFTRLFTVDCRNEAAPLLKTNDSAGVEAAFGRLGQIAMTELMTDPAVAQSISGVMAYMDAAAIAEVAK